MKCSLLVHSSPSVEPDRRWKLAWMVKTCQHGCGAPEANTSWADHHMAANQLRWWWIRTLKSRQEASSRRWGSTCWSAYQPHRAALSLVGSVEGRGDVPGNNRKWSRLVDFFCSNEALLPNLRAQRHRGFVYSLFWILFSLVRFSSVQLCCDWWVLCLYSWSHFSHISYNNNNNLQSCCFSAVMTTRSESSLSHLKELFSKGSKRSMKWDSEKINSCFLCQCTEEFLDILKSCCCRISNLRNETSSCSRTFENKACFLVKVTLGWSQFYSRNPDELTRLNWSMMRCLYFAESL